MRRAWSTWSGVADLLKDAVGAFVLVPAVRLLQLVDDAHDTDPEGDEP